MISGHWENPGGILKFKVISLENTSFRHCVQINPKKEISENYKNSEILENSGKVSVSECFSSKAGSPKLSTSLWILSEEYSKCFRKAVVQNLQTHV